MNSTAAMIATLSVFAIGIGIFVALKIMLNRYLESRKVRAQNAALASWDSLTTEDKLDLLQRKENEDENDRKQAEYDAESYYEEPVNRAAPQHQDENRQKNSNISFTVWRFYGAGSMKMQTCVSQSMAISQAQRHLQSIAPHGATVVVIANPSGATIWSGQK
jgi:hypothetical protein